MPNHSMETVVRKFEDSGWKKSEEVKQVEPSRAVEMAAKQNIPVSVQEEVDAYLKLHEQIAALNKQLDGYKKTIRNHMEDNGITSIRGTEGKQVYLQDAKASNSTSTFTDYEISDIMVALADNELLRQVTEVRVNAQKLEGLLSLGKLPEEKVKEIKNLKIVRAGTPRFSVKK
jgi:hypothetical protein